MFLNELLIRFVKRHIHGGLPEPIDVDSLKQQIQELRQRNQQLEDDVSQLRTQVLLLLLLSLNCNNHYFCFSLPSTNLLRRTKQPVNNILLL